MQLQKPQHRAQGLGLNAGTPIDLYNFIYTYIIRIYVGKRFVSVVYRIRKSLKRIYRFCSVLNDHGVFGN